MRRHRRSRHRALSTGALLVLAIACSDDGAEPTSADPAEFAAQELEASDGRDLDDATTTTAEPIVDPSDVPGAPILRFNLETGDCYDEFEVLANGVTETKTTELPCEEAHRFQIFHRFTYPAEHPSVYPGESVMRDYASQVCYRQFEAWVGREYELSELEIGVIIPPRENFEDDAARYRGVHCSVTRVDGEPMVGTAQGSGW